VTGSGWRHGLRASARRPPDPGTGPAGRIAALGLGLAAALVPGALLACALPPR
jgi:hypothetical protein